MWRRWITVVIASAVSWVSVLGSSNPAAAEGPAAPQLMPAEKARQLRAQLPQVDDEHIQKILNDPRLMLYTEEEMPRAYQDWDGALPGVHWAHYNISANGREPYGNGNLEFPWGTPGGTHRSPNVSTFRFLWLPLDASGNTLPITWYRTHLTGDRSMGYAWTFPIGTVIGEVLMMDSPQGERVTFELRIRSRESDDWDVNVFRPFPSAEDLAKRVEQLRPKYQEQPPLRSLVGHLRQPLRMAVGRITSRHPRRTVFTQRMGIDTLPPVNDDQLVTRLLRETTFQSVLGEDWREGSNGVRTAAPTTLASYHIVPANYDAGFIDVDKVSCMRCHETANTHVRDYEPGRDWYGRVRGADGIFSFHPWEPGTISWNGYSRHPGMRAELVNTGWLAPFDPSVHSNKYYTRIAGLDE